MKKTMLMTFISGIIFSACKEEVKSELWYQQHPEETYNIYITCVKNNDTSPRCENSKKAAIHFKNFGTEDEQEKFSTID